MKTIIIFFLTGIIFSSILSYSQSIIIGDGAEIVVGSNSDICASNWGSISGNITGPGTQCAGVLPVVLISFSAAVENVRDIKLSWITAIEINNSGFEIERHQIGNVWVKVGWVNGSGNANLPKEYNFTDRGLNKGIYNYRIKQIDYNGFSEYFNLSDRVEIRSPGVLSLSQNYPNPSNPVSNIKYQVPSTTMVVIKVYDISGREVIQLVNEIQEAGYYDIKFDGANLASGIYFYKLTTKENSLIKKLALVK